MRLLLVINNTNLFMKNFQRGIAPLIIILIALGVIVVGGAGYVAVKKSITPQQQIVGGDRDAHGCIGSAGYSWCEIKQKCLRMWEEKCEVAKITDVNIPLYTDLSASDKQLVDSLTKDDGIKNIVSNTRDFITKYYKNDPNPCTNKDVIRKMQTLTLPKTMCKSNSASYAVSQSLVSIPSASWCTDSSGFVGQGIINNQGNTYHCTATNIPTPSMPKFIPVPN